MSSDVKKNAAARSRWAEFGLLIAALWLFAVVVIFVIVQINRTHVPLNEWPARILRLLGA